MKKEVVLAIITGFIIGLLITFGIYTARTSLEKNTPAASPSVAQPINAGETPQPKGLNIIKPLNESLVDTDTVQIQGTTFANAALTIITPLENLIISADENGSFSTQIELEGGLNQILITSFDKQATDSSQILHNITYSTAEI